MSYGMAGRDFHGDPFLGGIIGTIAKGAIGLGKKALGLDRPRYVPTHQAPMPVMPGGRLPRVVPTPGARGRIQRILPGGQTGYQVEPGARPRRKRINPANPKALRRANRRQDGFGKLARRALKGSGYTITSRSSRRPRRDLGAGHTHVR